MRWSSGSGSVSLEMSSKPARRASWPRRELETAQWIGMASSQGTQTGASQSQAKGLVSFLDYVLGPGQNTIKKLSYAPLPSAVDSQAKSAVKTLTCNGSPLS